MRPRAPVPWVRATAPVSAIRLASIRTRAFRGPVGGNSSPAVAPTRGGARAQGTHSRPRGCGHHRGRDRRPDGGPPADQRGSGRQRPGGRPARGRPDGHPRHRRVPARPAGPVAQLRASGAEQYTGARRAGPAGLRPRRTRPQRGAAVPCRRRTERAGRTPGCALPIERPPRAPRRDDRTGQARCLAVPSGHHSGVPDPGPARQGRARRTAGAWPPAPCRRRIPAPTALGAARRPRALHVEPHGRPDPPRLRARPALRALGRFRHAARTPGGRPAARHHTHRGACDGRRHHLRTHQGARRTRLQVPPAGHRRGSRRRTAAGPAHARVPPGHRAPPHHR